MKRLLQLAVVVPFAVHVGLLAWFRPVIWKLADRTLCYADWDGFVEAALPGLHPGGALFYLGHLLSTTGLCDVGFVVPYLLLQALIAVLWNRLFPRNDGHWNWTGAWLALVLNAAAFLHLGPEVWIVYEPAYPLLNLLGLALVLALLLLNRVVSPWISAAVSLVLFVPCGLYALVPLLAGRLLPSLVAAVCAVVSIPWIYSDVALPPTLGYSQAVVNSALLSPSGLWPLLCFLFPVFCWYRARLPFSFRDRWLLLALPLLFLFLPAYDVRPQLSMERAVLANDWEGVLSAFSKDTELRLAHAYRILALHRLGRLDDELFLAPPHISHRATDADETKMDGELLLFAYGLLNPARYRITESVAEKGWQPRHLRLLGDIARVGGEGRLAERYYRQLARCPFRRAWAEARRTAQELPVDLAPVEEFAFTWQDYVLSRKDPPFFHFDMQNIEVFIYERMLRIQTSPPPNVARMLLAAYLLERDKKAFIRNMPIMNALCPDKPWPRAWQEGVLARLRELSPEELAATAKTIRPGALSEDNVARLERFSAACADAAQRQLPESELCARLRRDFGDTFWYYDVVVK